MGIYIMPKLLFLLLISTSCFAENLLLKNVLIYDGFNQPPTHGDVRIAGDRITAVAPHSLR